uniref:Uncharacterized protein n=1 Tax=Anguilla anguilla TaxID=7936 RepID=A0A0E9T8Y6_ANGAN
MGRCSIHHLHLLSSGLFSICYSLYLFSSLV